VPLSPTFAFGFGGQAASGELDVYQSSAFPPLVGCSC
jgi:hypothetical protein